MDEQKIAELAEAWQDADDKLKTWKKKELELRKELAGAIVDIKGMAAKKIVTIASLDGEMIDITAEAKVTNTLDHDQFEYMRDNGELTTLAVACVTYKPYMSAAMLKKLDDDDAMWDCISQKPATPTVKITHTK